MTTSDERAVSPVVAVILMVAVTVALSATVGLFVFDIGQNTSDSAQQGDIGVRTSVDNGEAVAQVVTGEAKEVKLVINGSVEKTVTDVRAGDTISAPATDDSQVSVVTVNDGQESVVATSGPSGEPAETAPPKPSDGLVAHWSLDDDSDDTLAVDEQDNYDATLGGGPSYDSDAISGTALELDGSDDWGDTGYSDLNSNVSFAFWMKTTADSGSVLESRNGGQQNNFHFRLISDDKLQFHRQNDGWGSKVEAFGSGIQDGKWHHVVGTYNHNTGDIALYINGELADSDSGSPFTMSNPDAVALGRWSDRDNRHFAGSLDEVHIYDRVLSGEEAKDHYEATK